jgi:hypothetical protein
MEMEKVDYAAWIGMDWGSYQHAICLQAAGSSSVARHTLEQKPEALHAWATNLRAHFGGAKVAIAIEQTRGAVIHFLLGFYFVHVFTIHPKSLKNYREALHPSGAKDDPTDAELLLQFAMAHQDKIKPWAPAEPEIRLLLRLSEFRRKTVGKRVRLTNELTQLLKEYFPAALDCAGELDTVMACDFLLKWPTLKISSRDPFSAAEISPEKTIGLYPWFTMEGAFGIILTILECPPSILDSLAIESFGASETTTASLFREDFILSSASAMAGGWSETKTRLQAAGLVLSAQSVTMLGMSRCGCARTPALLSLTTTVPGSFPARLSAVRMMQVTLPPPIKPIVS